MRIGLLSDTHGYLDEAVFRHFDACDEVWHAGDFGTWEIVEKLERFKPLRGVFGNIDGRDIRNRFPETLHFTVEELNVMMQHIGGYPNRYAKGVKENILQHKSGLFISGHSHILKIMYDDALNCLHINPGAAGRQGWHNVRTIIRFSISKKNIEDCEVIELQ